jgi:hypothetical protein
MGERLRSKALSWTGFAPLLMIDSLDRCAVVLALTPFKQ